jgi:tRNA U55 pseudouridine synthase TruB
VSTRRKVAEYPVARLDFDAKLAKQVHTRKQKGESIKSIAADLNLGLGKTAMAELVATEGPISIEDPAKLAKAVAKDREDGASWGVLAARYRVTEGTVRAAYEAATGKPWKSIDYRRAS